MSRSEDPWKCSISLRFITDKNGQAYAPARNEAFGDTILDKAQVEERLRRAQRAILNPSTPARQFLTSDDEDTPSAELTFSTNYVSVQISGPDVADLSFCDLPGELLLPNLVGPPSVLTAWCSRLDCECGQRRKRQRHQTCPKPCHFIHLTAKLCYPFDHRLRK